MKAFPIFLLALAVFHLHCDKGDTDFPAPEVDFSYAPSQFIGVGDTIIFTAVATNADSFFWDFRDGTTATGASSVKVYEKPAFLAVSCTAFGKGGSTNVTRAILIDPFKYKMIKVDGGTFMMGCTPGDADCSADELPAHEVTLSEFYLAETEVTQAEWQSITGENPSEFKNCPDCPVDNVGWSDVQAFVEKLNTWTGYTYHLPTEAQWEYAARAGEPLNRWSGSDAPAEVGWYHDNFQSVPGMTKPVKGLAPNAWGFYDMTGNAWELCGNLMEEYSDSPQSDPQGVLAAPGSMRGGFILNEASGCRVSVRTPGHKAAFIGFRLARKP